MLKIMHNMFKKIIQIFLQNLYCESLIVKKGKDEDIVNLIKGLTMHERGS